MYISIIMTTFNASKYLINTVESIAKQTYQQYEVVIVDDGSTDDTIALLHECFSKYPLIDVHIYSREHTGRAAVLNYAVSLAKYDWLAIIDADDLWSCKKLELQVKIVTDYNLDFLATGSKIFFKDTEVNINECITEHNHSLSQISLPKMLYGNAISHSSVLVRKNLINYNPDRKSQIDYEMWLRLLQSGQSIFLLDEILVFHRIHKDQSFEAKKQLRYSLNAIVLQLKYCVRNIKLLPFLYVLIKLGYYLLLPKKVRLKLRGFLCFLKKQIKINRLNVVDL